MTEQARSQLSPRHSQLNEVDAVTDRSEKHRNPAGEEMDRNHKHQVAEASAQYLADIAPQPTPEDDTCPPGYKRTEVGVIPEDWEICELQEAVHFLDGLRRPIKSGDRAKISGVYPYYGASGIVDYVNDYIFDDELILLGEDGENILSRNLPLAFKVSGKIWVNNHAHVLKPKENFDITYLTDFLESLDYSLLNSGTAQPKLNKQACAKIKIAKPQKKEQTAIANALSDMDALIDGLEKLIAKKQAIKTATMQQLLTGRTRLPQFALREDGTPTNSSGTNLDAGTGGPKGEGQDGLRNGYKQSELGEIPEDWEVVYLNECGEFQSGNGFPTKYQGLKEGKYPFFKVSDMNNPGNEKFLKNSNNFIPDYVRSLISARVIAVNSIIFAKIGAAIFLERKRICSQSSCIDNNMMAFTADENKLHYEYAYLLFMSMNLGDLVEATALPSLSGNDIGQRKVALPSKKEQTAIATILSDMDEEIQALQQRLAKTRQIKQGMMQELLTGRVRLTSGKLKVESGK